MDEEEKNQEICEFNYNDKICSLDNVLEGCACRKKFYKEYLEILCEEE